MRVKQESCELLNGVEVTQLDMLKLVEAMEARSRSHPDEDFYAGVHEEVERLFGRTEKASDYPALAEFFASRRRNCADGK